VKVEQTAVHCHHPHTAASTLVEAMLRPEMYPERPQKIELRQTHISYAFLAGDFVYKVKKPVHFSFLDASTLTHRYRLCLEEVRLNRRMAPDVYLDVVPIVWRDGRLKLAEAGADDMAVEEYAVKMRRLDEDGMLDRMLSAGDVSIAQIRAVAARIAAFHAATGARGDGANDAAKAWRYGSAAAVWRVVHGNLLEVEDDCAELVRRDEMKELERFVDRSVETLWGLLNQRALGGSVCEGHGDLRCEHVSLEDNRIRIIDCVEFSESLRYVDVASDVAFLAMDLDRLGADELSDEFVAAYRSASGDGGLARLLPFYKIHRALVRTKVAALTSHDSNVSAEGRSAAAKAARGYLTLALKYAREACPALVVICGMSGTGKSTVAQRIQDRTGFDLMRSDVVRKHLAGVAPTARLSTDYGAGSYSREFSERTYAALLADVATRLAEGSGVIADATFAVAADRVRVREAAAHAGVPILFVECTASEREVMRRLEQRERRTDEVSDAGTAVYLRQRHTFAPLTEIPERLRLVVDTTGGINAATAAVRQRLADLP
jgi:aminoglycoside phosphotransferase family enzyme/predicted kinase